MLETWCLSMSGGWCLSLSGAWCLSLSGAWCLRFTCSHRLSFYVYVASFLRGFYVLK